MRKTWARSLAVLLAVMLLILQIAGSSPVLHDFLHGAAAHRCDAHNAPDGQTNDGLSGHVCAVILIAGGVALSSVASLATLQPAACGTVTAETPIIVFPAKLRRPSPRAPPFS